MRNEKTIKILVVDDEAIIRESLRDWLTDAGYKVLMAEDGPRALGIIEKEMPSIAIVDLIMPGMDGIELLKKAKEISPDIEVILVTAYASIPTAIAAMKEGEVVARYYWGEGEPEYIFLVPGSHFLVNRPPLLGIFEKGDPIDYGAHIDALMEDYIAPWHPAYVDLLADDWYVLPKECREARNHKPTHQENRL